MGLRQRLEELSTAQEMPEAAKSGAPSRGEILELEEALRQSELRVRELWNELARTEEKRLRDAAELEVCQEQAELEHYHALEVERQRWEDKERCLLDCFAEVGEGLQTVRRHDGNSETTERLETAEQKLALLSGQLESSETLVQRLSEERDMLRRENRELERLRSTRSPCVDSVTMDRLGAAERWLQLQSQQLESSETPIYQLFEEGDRLRSQNQEVEELRAELTTVRTTVWGPRWQMECSSAVCRASCIRSQAHAKWGGWVTQQE